MRINSRPALRGLIVPALIVVLFFGVRAELTTAQRSSTQLWTQMAAGLRADADLYCYERQADGCWSPAEIDEHDERIVARKE